MQRQSVISSRIKEIGWENNILEIQFHNNNIYHYYDVSETEFQQFINSASLGRALSVLDKQHKYSRVN